MAVGDVIDIGGIAYVEVDANNVQNQDPNKTYAMVLSTSLGFNPDQGTTTVTYTPDRASWTSMVETNVQGGKTRTRTTTRTATSETKGPWV